MRTAPLTLLPLIVEAASAPDASPNPSSEEAAPERDERSNQNREPSGTPTSMSPETERSSRSPDADPTVMSPEADAIRPARASTPTSMSPEALRPFRFPPIDPIDTSPTAVVNDTSPSTA